MDSLDAGLKARSTRMSLFSAVCLARLCGLSWC